MNKILEICCYTIESAILAEQAGADRIELCDNFSEGGTTPSFSTIKQTIDKLKIPINVIVRPRGGDFLYTQNEIEIIKSDVQKIKELGAAGVVIGFLNKDGSIDVNRTKEIVSIARPMEVTFHRAFDMCNDPILALEQLKELSVDRILTSGQKNTAIEGAELISELVKAADDKIIIMPGSGINDLNVREIMTFTKALEFHSSAKTFVKSKMKFINENISMGGKTDIDENELISVAGETIRKMKTIISEDSL